MTGAGRMPCRSPVRDLDRPPARQPRHLRLRRCEDQRLIQADRVALARHRHSAHSKGMEPCRSRAQVFRLQKAHPGLAVRLTARRALWGLSGAAATPVPLGIPIRRGRCRRPRAVQKESVGQTFLVLCARCFGVSPRELNDSGITCHTVVRSRRRLVIRICRMENCKPVSGLKKSMVA